MKLVKYIFCLVVLFALVYSTGFCFFYGVTMEDWVFMLMSVCFAGLAYFWNVMFHLENNEYTKRVISILGKVME